MFTVTILCTLSLVTNVLVLNLNCRDINIENDLPKWVS